jgi:hypothetical protein
MSKRPLLARRYVYPSTAALTGQFCLDDERSSLAVLVFYVLNYRVCLLFDSYAT